MNRAFLVLILIGAIGCDTSAKQNAKPSTQLADLAAEVQKLRSEVKSAAAAQEVIVKITQAKHDALFDLVDSTNALENKLKKSGRLPKDSHLVSRALIVPGHDPLATLALQTQKVTGIATFLRKQF